MVTQAEFDADTKYIAQRGLEEDGFRSIPIKKETNPGSTGQKRIQIIICLNKGEIIAALQNNNDLKESVVYDDWYAGEGDTFEEAFKDALDACDWKAELLAR